MYQQSILKRLLCFCIVVFATVSPVSAQEDQSGDEKTTVEKRIVVNARRLPDSGDAETALPAAVTVISRRDIEASSARTLQELLSGWAGFTVVDNTGNGIETAIGLRGFSDGNALAVYVNGVRVNEPDSNLAHLEFIDLASIERIEILPGAGSASRGGGATAGSINIILRGGEDPGADVLRAGGGSHATREAAVQSARRFGKHGYFLSARLLDSDGFRDNGASEQRNLFAAWRYGDPARDGFEISWRQYDGEMGNPGALTREELERDRSANPYNRVDFGNSDERVISGRFGASPFEEMQFSLLGWRRESTIEVLTTGRAAALYGGFHSTTDAEGMGFTGQVRWLPAEIISITGGLDYQRDEFGNSGSYTDAQGAPTFSANDRETVQRNVAAYGEVALDVDGWLTLQAGLRHDRIDMEFAELLEDRADETDFSQTSGSFGALVNLGPATIWGRFSQSFQAPTVNDLFAFPFFGSNPDLKPTEGETWEAGLRFAGDGYSAQASLFRMNLENEVVFVILDPASFYGRNENVGESRRFGFEGSFSGELQRNLDLRLGYAWTRAKNLSLAAETGVDELLIPLVPEHSFSATLRIDLSPLMFAWTSIYTGSQIQGSDSYNLGEPLASFLLHHAVATWDEGAWGLRIEVRNLLDEAYEPRAIYSFGASYYTPAAGRTANLSISFTY